MTPDSVPGNIGLDVNCDNTKSRYINMNFFGMTNTTWYLPDCTDGSFPVFGHSDINGVWINFNATSDAFRVGPYKMVDGQFYTGTCWYKTIGTIPSQGYLGGFCFAGDIVGVSIGPHFIAKDVTTGFASFCGCWTFSGPIADGAQFIRVKGGVNNCGLNNHFGGTVRDSIFGMCFAGAKYGSIGDANYGGDVRNTTVQGLGSEGMYHYYPETFKSFAGTRVVGEDCNGVLNNAIIQNVTYGNVGDETAGTNLRPLWPKTFTAGTHAMLTTHFSAGDSANIILTSKYSGRTSNGISLTITNGGKSGTFTTNTVDLDILITKFTSTAKTGGQLVTLINTDGNSPAVATLVGDGTGNIDNTYAQTYLAGGSSPPLFKGNASYPIRCTEPNTFVSPFYNGGTYQMNVGAYATTSDCNVYLPPADPNMQYEYGFVDNNPTYKMTITPYSGDQIRRSTGTLLAANQTDTSDASIFGRTKLKCYEPNIWTEDANSGWWIP